MPLPSDDTTPPVTNMYLVSTCLKVLGFGVLHTPFSSRKGKHISANPQKNRPKDFFMSFFAGIVVIALPEEWMYRSKVLVLSVGNQT